MSVVRILVLASLLASLGHPKAAIGTAFCTCGRQPCNAILEADAVFLATVNSVEVMPRTPGVNRGFAYVAAALTDVEPLRGVSEAAVLTNLDGGSCGYDFEEGARYLIHAYRGPDGRLWTSICSRTQPVEPAAGLIEYLHYVQHQPDQSVVWGSVGLLQDPRARLLSEATTPIEGARIALSGPEEVVVETNREGLFFLTGLAYGTYGVSISLPEHLWFLTTRDPFEIELSSPHGCADLRFIAR